MIGEYVKLNDVTINIVNTDKKILCVLNETTCLLDNNNNIKQFTDIFKNSYFETNINRDRENEDPNDPENSGEGHAAVSSRFGDNNWSLDFWNELSRESNLVGQIVGVIFREFDSIVMRQTDLKIMKNILQDKNNTYIIFTENK